MKFFLPILSGILAAFSFSSKEFALFIFISLIPMLYAGLKYSLSKSIALFSFSYHLILMLWLYKLSSQTHPVVIFFMIIFIAVVMMILYWIPFKFFTPKTSIAIIATFILSECTPLLLGPLSFPWGRLGVILTPIPEFIQTASIFGSLGISAFILAINMLLTYFILHKNKKYILYTFLIISIQFIYGYLVINQEKPSNETYKVSIVQGNISSISKWQTTIADTIKTYLTLTDEAIKEGGELIIYPETSFPTTLTSSIKDNLLNYTDSKNIELIVGCYFSEEGTDYNALVNPKNNSRYYKQMLVPIGEFVPFAKLLKYENEIGFGKKSDSIETSKGKLGAMICYDSIFSNIMRKSVLNGANILVVSSNDSWFEFTPALYQHHAHGIMRAVESRRYLVRSANSGLSSIISPYGEVLKSLKPYISDTLTYDVSNSSKITPYVLLGDWIALLALFLMIYTKYIYLKKSK